MRLRKGRRILWKKGGSKEAGEILEEKILPVHSHCLSAGYGPRHVRVQFLRDQDSDSGLWMANASLTPTPQLPLNHVYPSFTPLNS